MVKSSSLTNDGLDSTSDATDEAFEPSYAEPTYYAIQSSDEESLDQTIQLSNQELAEELKAIELKIRSIEDQIRECQEIRATLLSDKTDVLRKLEATHRPAPTLVPIKGKQRDNGTRVDYNGDFDWTLALRTNLKKIFNIEDFRLCQKGVCNANMDGRDIVCLMPTGGGKSLTYQLPAVMAKGCTLVVSPLIALMADQVHHMEQAGVEAVMLTHGLSAVGKRDVRQRLVGMAEDSGTSRRDIKLCYVTPEKIANSKDFLPVLQDLDKCGKLARIVIDEGHCVSQLGHNYRPDYKKLSMLRKLFPKVPMLVLSATCPPKVLEDVLSILRLGGIVPGNDAPSKGTVFFSSPLYRKNLHYHVLEKPQSTTQVYKAITEYILQKHAGHSGIIYCFSKKDTEKVAQGIFEQSKGKIKTGVYHADVGDATKMQLHKQWRDGAVQVVCATIAFGLGIDKSNVRFVIHHSISKSLDGFYQESGRAGRDGGDADCVLYYRPQDWQNVEALTYSELGGKEKLHDMLRFAQDLEQCRKIHFAKYFSTSSKTPMASWTTVEEDATTRCGHCDNCTRAPETVVRKDVTLEAWQILKVAEYVQERKGTATLGQLSELARGGAKSEFNFDSHTRKGKQGSAKGSVDLENVCGGKVQLPKEHAEGLCMKLLLDGYLEEAPSVTIYKTIFYLNSGPRARDLTRFTRDELERGKGPKIVFSFLCKSRRVPSEKTRKESSFAQLDSDIEELPPSAHPAASSSRKRKAPEALELAVALGVEEVADDDGEDAGQSLEDLDSDDFMPQVRSYHGRVVVPESDESDFEEQWQSSLRPKPTKRRRTRIFHHDNRASTSSRLVEDHEVISLSSD